ncbi:MAG: ribose 5-phosphate isomerase B [Candidatus Nanohalarchaeota archaeon]|nr:MAG: ribose 5-phosphate isomerase B [Candidatus Nanohaloarchaeota archaeon]
MKSIVIASDHAGFELKEHLKAVLRDKGRMIIDVGTNSNESCHYPVFAKKLCKEVLKSNCFGILICGTGIGMSMAANRVNKIRAALCTTINMAQMARQHNDANVLCLGARILKPNQAEKIADAFLNEKFDKENKRHKIRIEMFD